jgi:hypothetical protein
MEETIAITQNPIKDRILTLYLEICATSATLQNVIVSKAPGNKQLLYKQFRNQVFEMYNLSHRYDRINKDVVKETATWMKAKNPNPKDKFIMYSIDVVDKYINELKRIEVLQM